MSELEHQRRPSYGATSPVIGIRGARTRTQIAEAALRCFTTKGYYETSVDDIASLASTSRATLYQYFASKDAIFIDLMIESGTSLARELRHIGPLGPDADGYAGLRRWLGESCRIFDTYAPMFIEWANVATSTTSLSEEVSAYVDFHSENFAVALESAGVERDDARVAGVVVLGVFTRFNYVRHVYRPGPTNSRLVESLSCALQRYLFPTTPLRVLAGGPRLDNDDASDWPPVTEMGPLGRLRSVGTLDPSDPFENVSDHSAVTVRHLLDAAGRVFATNGYHATNIDHIVNEAGFARGTFYRYFNDKSQLIIALSREASQAMRPLFAEFGTIEAVPNSAPLRDWLQRFLVVQRTYAGVLRAWTEGRAIDDSLLVGAAEVLEEMSTAIANVFGPPRAYPLDRRAAGMLLAGLLEHVPNEGLGAKNAPTDDQLVEAQAQFIERVVYPS